MSMNNSTDKSSLRKQKLMLRKGLEENEIIYISERAAENIRRLPQYKNADVVYFYMAIRNEVSVQGLLEECLRAGKQCVFPRVLNEFKMEFFTVSNEEQLKEGYKGIREPDEQCFLFENDVKNSIMLVPGAVFDRNGGRIGMGKGFYDRYISNHSIGCLAGICGEYQLVNKVPMDINDIYMDFVITENDIYKRN